VAVVPDNAIDAGLAKRLNLAVPAIRLTGSPCGVNALWQGQKASSALAQEGGMSAQDSASADEDELGAYGCQRR